MSLERIVTEAHEMAKHMGDAAANALTNCDTVSISLYNYGVGKRELPEVLKRLRMDRRFSSVTPEGFMGYVKFIKASE